MAKVCQDWFPMGSYKGQRSPGFYMHDNLKQTIDLWVKNVKNDWDFVIVISGGGTVRVGKSVIAQQIACYWHYAIWKEYGIEVPFDIKENIVFHGSQLIKKGNKIGAKYKYSSLIFDEAGADLEGVKVMKKTTQAVKDYLRECGQYNMLTILVLPEFFDLPKSIATNRTNALIDCYVTTNEEDIWVRGQFNFYSAPSKKKLYRIGKKELNYAAVKGDFSGDWDNVYTIDEKEYKEEKKKALKTREVISEREDKRIQYLKGCINILEKDFELTYREIARRITDKRKISANHVYISRLMSGEKDPEDDGGFTEGAAA